MDNSFHDNSDESARSVDALLHDDDSAAAAARRSRQPNPLNARPAQPVRKNPEDVGQLRRPQQPQEPDAYQREAPQRRPLTEEEREDMERQLDLKYGAEQVLALILPVSVCMIVVVATIRSVAFFATQDQQFVYSPYKESDGESSGARFGGALLNVIIIIAIIVAMTFLLVLLFYYECYRAINGWLVLSSCLLLFFFGYEYLVQIVQANNAAMDWITLAFTIWNFGCVGVTVIHWRGPLIVQQAYLIAVSALMALVLLKNLPEWTTWILLAAIAIYDLVAVLTPNGPLRMLVNLAEERDQPIFQGLIYSSTMAWVVTMADDGGLGGYNDTSEHTRKKKQQQQRQQQQQQQGVIQDQPAGGNRAAPDAEQQRQLMLQRQRREMELAQQEESEPEEEEEQSGVKLGLGDFIFYSVLVGKAATSDDWTTIFACYMGILVGLAATLLLLSIFQKALPALPLSIAFGLIFFFSTQHVLSPMVERLSLEQVFL